MMTKIEIAQRIAADHNRLSSVFASGGVVLQNSDRVIMMGDTIKDLRNLVQQLQADVEAEEREEEEQAKKAAEEAKGKK